MPGGKAADEAKRRLRLLWCSLLVDIMRYLILFLAALAITIYEPQARSLWAQKPGGKSLEFRAVWMGEIEDIEATKAGFRSDGWDRNHLGTTIFEASDGERLSVDYAEFSSPQEASRYFDWKVGKCSNILKQGAYTDPRTKSSGQRAEVVPPRGKKTITVMWTAGTRFREINAKSLPDALELEKRYGH
jgi:hypothetical protein